MKLRVVTSFFLFIIMLSCDLKNQDVQKEKDVIFNLESKAYKKALSGQYDSAIYFSNKMKALAFKNKDTVSIMKSYNRLRLIFAKQKKYDSAIYYGNKIYVLSKAIKDSLGMAKMLNRLGIYNYKLNNFREAYLNYNKSKILYLKHRDTVKASDVLLNIAHLEKKIGSFGQSQLSALEGLRYLEFIDNVKLRSKLNYILAVVLKESGDYETAMRKIDKALSYVKDSSAIKIIKKENVYKYWNTKANIFQKQKKYRNALMIYDSLLSVVKKNKKSDSLEIARIYNNLAYTLYLRDGFNKKSDSLLEIVTYINEKRKDISLEHSNYIKKAKLYKNKNLQKSLKYLDNAICNALELGNDESVYEALEIKIRYDDDIKKEEKDYFFLLGDKLKKKREDISSLFAVNIFDYNESARKQAAKDKEILRKGKNNQLLLLTLVCFLIIVAFIYFQIKRRHKIEKVKTVHKTEARISSKVHDELANDVYKLMTQLETSDPDKEIILDKLDMIYANARDISKQIQTVDTGKAFPDELNNLLRSYNSDTVNVMLKRYNIEIWNDIPAHIKVTSYRVLQELLTNMKKHSDASLVIFSIGKQNKQLHIQYIDNGKGFSKEISKNGLQNAENRIHAISGTLNFDTELHKGCKFSINVPV